MPRDRTSDSNVEVSTSTPRSGGSGGPNGAHLPHAFPQKLHNLIDVEDDDVICWSHHGFSFIIKDTERFVKEILSKYFRHQKLTSFQRQLNLYGFRRLTKGPDAGAYLHPRFHRDHPEFLSSIKRTNKQRLSTGSSGSGGGGIGSPRSPGGTPLRRYDQHDRYDSHNHHSDHGYFDGRHSGASSPHSYHRTSSSGLPHLQLPGMPGMPGIPGMLGIPGMQGMASPRDVGNKNDYGDNSHRHQVPLSPRSADPAVIGAQTAAFMAANGVPPPFNIATATPEQMQRQMMSNMVAMQHMYTMQMQMAAALANHHSSRSGSGSEASLSDDSDAGSGKNFSHSHANDTKAAAGILAAAKTVVPHDHSTHNKNCGHPDCEHSDAEEEEDDGDEDMGDIQETKQATIAESKTRDPGSNVQSEVKSELSLTATPHRQLSVDVNAEPASQPHHQRRPSHKQEDFENIVATGGTGVSEAAENAASTGMQISPTAVAAFASADNPMMAFATMAAGHGSAIRKPESAAAR